MRAAIKILIKDNVVRAMPRKKTDNNEKSEQAVASEKAAGARLDDLKSALAKGNVLFGGRSVLKALKAGDPKIVFIASNCPDSIKQDIISCARISGANVETFEGTAKQMGIFCGKPFAIASLAVRAEHKK